MAQDTVRKGDFLYKDNDIDRISADFEPLIKHYANKCRNESERQEMEAELWSFLWDLVKSGRAISKRYVAVSIRNRYIYYSKSIQKTAATETEFEPNFAHPTEDDFVEKIAMRDLLDKLGIKQRETIVLHHVYGLSFAEIAKKYNCTRQYTTALNNRGLKRLREILETNDKRIENTERKAMENGRSFNICGCGDNCRCTVTHRCDYNKQQGKQ